MCIVKLAALPHRVREFTLRSNNTWMSPSAVTHCRIAELLGGVAAQYLAGFRRSQSAAQSHGGTSPRGRLACVRAGVQIETSLNVKDLNQEINKIKKSC